MVLVTGATGKQGGAVARSLLRQGATVRVLTRSRAKGAEWEKPGAEIAVGDLTDRASLNTSLKGVKGVFLVTTPFERGMDDEVRQGKTMADAAKAAGVEHLVYTSVGSADRQTGIPHFETKWEVEQYLRKTGLPFTILRPVFFMENFASPWMLPAIQQGTLTFPLPPDRKLQMIALQDIGEFGAAALLRPKEFVGEVIALAGDELTLPAALEILSRTMGKPIRYAQLPDDQIESALGHDFAVMFRWFIRVGYSVDIPALRKRWGIPLTRFQNLVPKASWAKGA